MSTISSDDLTKLRDWLVKRGEPDSGIRYEARNPHSGDRIAHVELHGSDADFVAKHFHGQGARDLAAALDQLLSLRESHPIEDGEGWVLVPREPTEAMKQDGMDVLMYRGDIYSRPDGQIVIETITPADLWRAMLAASPSNPGTSKVENSRST